MTDSTQLASFLSLPDLATPFHALLNSVQQFPVEGSMPLTIAGKIAGFIHPKAQGVLTQHHFITTTPEAMHIGYPYMPRPALNELLAKIALCLHQGGCTRAWRNELLNVYAEGQVIAQMERTALRPLGLLTSAVHLNAWTPDFKLYLSLRSPSKSTDPNKWDTLAGGLLNANDTPLQGLIRESDEEAGLDFAYVVRRTPLRTILRMRRQLPEGYQLEDILVSDCVLQPGTPLQNKDGEVAQIRTFTPKEVVEMIQRHEITTEAALVLYDSFLNLPKEALF